MHASITKKKNQHLPVKSFSQLLPQGLNFEYYFVYLGKSRLNVCVSDKTGNVFKTIMQKTLLNQLNIYNVQQIISHKITQWYFLPFQPSLLVTNNKYSIQERLKYCFLCYM